MDSRRCLGGVTYGRPESGTQRGDIYQPGFELVLSARKWSEVTGLFDDRVPCGSRRACNVGNYDSLENNYDTTTH
jgi:hypothetical protein